MVKTRGGGRSTKTGRTTRSTTRREPMPHPAREATASPAREATPPPPPPPRTEAEEQQKRITRPRNVVYASRKRQKKTRDAEPAMPIEQDHRPSPQELIPPPRQRTEAGSSSHQQGTKARPPEKLFFNHTEYAKTCKMSSKCEDATVMELLKDLTEGEKNWFRNHPQFQHVWHMDRSKNHKLMSMWMLLLRTVSMEKGKICWFVVNGVPIRYSLREHALISGLDCRMYPPHYDKLGSLGFARRNFGRVENITVGEVKGQLKHLLADGDRLKMAVLLFLSTVIKGSRRYGYIDPFILRIVDDLEACTTFPWGRYTFDDCIYEIFNMMENFEGRAKETWCFPGFIFPLEFLACESIPTLKKKLRENVVNADIRCPRMCKQKWRHSYMRGFPLEEVNDSLGDPKEIISVLEPEMHELDFLSRILEDGVDDEGEDQISMNWNKCIVEENQKIFWEDFYNLDKAGRGAKVSREKKKSGKAGVPDNLLEVVMKAMEDGFDKMNDRIVQRFDELEMRVKNIEKYVYPSRFGDNTKNEEAVAGSEAAAKNKGKALAEEDDDDEERKGKGKGEANLGISSGFGQLRDDDDMDFLYKAYGESVIKAAKQAAEEKKKADEVEEEEKEEENKEENEDEDEEENEDEEDDSSEEEEEYPSRCSAKAWAKAKAKALLTGKAVPVEETSSDEANEDKGGEKGEEREKGEEETSSDEEEEEEEDKEGEKGEEETSSDEEEEEEDKEGEKAEEDAEMPSAVGEEEKGGEMPSAVGEKEKGGEMPSAVVAPSSPAEQVTPSIVGEEEQGGEMPSAVVTPSIPAVGSSEGRKHRPKVCVNPFKKKSATKRITRAATERITRAATEKAKRTRKPSKLKQSPYV